MCVLSLFVSDVYEIVSINVNACQSYKTIIYQIPLFGNDYIRINSFPERRIKVVVAVKVVEEVMVS